jgi:V/A-type H+-transporting ATPase subunit I
LKEKIKSVGIIAHKSIMEPLSKFFLDSESFEVVPIRSVLDLKLGSMDRNPYDEFLSLVHSLYKEVGKTPSPKVETVTFPMVFDGADFQKLTARLKKEMENIDSRIADLEEKIRSLEESISAVKAFLGFEETLSSLCEMKLLRIRVGKVHYGYFERLAESLSDLDVMIEKISQEEEDVVSVLVYPAQMKDSIERVLKSVSFRDLDIPCMNLDPQNALYELMDERKALRIKIEELKLEKREIFYQNRRKIYQYYDQVFVLKNVHDLISNGGLTEEFFVIMGWITEKSLKDLKDFAEGFNDILIFEDIEIPLQKPTKLSNPGFFKHFEFLVKMYGTPRSDEVDPTPIVSILFLFFYGFMFGDVGHGLVIAALSWLIYLKTKTDLWYAMTFAGLSSVVFGIFYGSIFGFEVIPAVIARPMENINEFLVTSIYIGAGLIIFGMALNILNRIHRKEYKQVVFDPNGIAGLGLYTLAFVGTVYYLNSGTFPIPVFVFLGSILAFIALMFLYYVIFEEGKIGERITLAVFETFDRLLMFFSNTLSFIRLGAFAMNHAGLFLAFYMMAQMSKSGFGSFTSLLIGNLLLIFLEGLIVFIQSVRLEFYEFFSKFYSGDGREFNPVRYKDPEGGVY